MLIPQLLAAALALAAAPPTEAPSQPTEGVALFLSAASSGRVAPAECVKAAVSRLRDRLAAGGSVRLVEKADEAAVVVDVRECGSRRETSASGEVGVGVTVGGGRYGSRGGGSEGGISIHRQQYGYVVLRARSDEGVREFSSLHRTELFDEAVSVAADRLLDWIDEQARGDAPR
jgi:hypothetical protein